MSCHLEKVLQNNLVNCMSKNIKKRTIALLAKNIKEKILVSSQKAKMPQL